MTLNDLERLKRIQSPIIKKQFAGCGHNVRLNLVLIGWDWVLHTYSVHSDSDRPCCAWLTFCTDTVRSDPIQTKCSDWANISLILAKWKRMTRFLSVELDRVKTYRRV